MVVSPHAPLMLVTTSSGVVHLLDLGNPLRLATLATMTTRVGNLYRTHVSFSPAHPVMVAQEIAYPAESDNTSSPSSQITIIDISDPAHPRQRGQITSDQSTVQFTADGDLIQSFSQDGLHMWDLSDLDKPLRSPVSDPPIPVGWSAVALTRPILATGGEEGMGISIVDIAGPPRELARIPGKAPGIFSPDGRLLTVSAQQAVHIWDVADPGNPQQVATLAVSSNVAPFAFSPDGTGVVIAQPDGLRYVVVDVEIAIKGLCERAHPRITDEQWERYVPELDYRSPCP